MSEAAGRASDGPAKVINCPEIPAAEKAASRSAMERLGIEDAAPDEHAAELSARDGRAAVEAAEAEPAGRVASTSYHSVYHFLNTSLSMSLVSPNRESTFNMKDLFSYRHSRMRSKKRCDSCILFKI